MEKVLVQLGESVIRSDHLPADLIESHKIEYKKKFFCRHDWIIYQYFSYSRMRRICSKCGKKQIGNHMMPLHQTGWENVKEKRNKKKF